MWMRIARFEFLSRMSRASTWIYFLVFFALAMLWIAAAGGMLKHANISFGSGKVFVNSPFALAQTVSILGMFGIIVMAAVMGRAVQQDAEHRTHHFFFTSPITRLDYLGGRFLGGFGVVLAIFASIGLGAWMATFLPGMDAERLGPNRFAAYFWPYALVLLPNALVFGSLFFVIAAVTRKMLPVYVGSVLCVIGYLIALQLLRDMDNKTLASLVDPFGTTAMGRVTEYWTVADRNSRLLPLEGVLLWNRLLWLGIGALIALFGFFRFSFARFANEPLSGGRDRMAGHGEDDAVDRVPMRARPTNAAGAIAAPWLGLLPRLVWRNLRETVKNVYFGVLVLAGLLFLVFASTTLGNIFGTSTWPVTYQMTGLLGGTFSLFMLIIITFYAGELVWRERDHRLDQILDATPAPTWLLFAAKLLALMLIPVLLQALLMLFGMGVQLSKGYHHFEIDLYLEDLLGLQLLEYWLLCVLALTVHSVINHKYMGHFAMIVYYIAVSFGGALGYEHNLYKYGAIPEVIYSDMNGFGHFLPRAFAFHAYWYSAAGLLLVAAYLGWARGTAGGAAERMAVARARFRGRVPVAAALFAVSFLGMGACIFYNTNVLNEYRNSSAALARQADYEKLYKATAHIPQPRIVKVDVKADLHPQEQRVRMSGTYRLVNKNAVPVTDVWLGFLAGRALSIRRLEFDGGADMVDANESIGVRHYKLRKTLLPGGEATLAFDLELSTPGFMNAGSNTHVVRNGTFINGRAVLPVIGYQDSYELARDQDRKKHGLAPKERMRDRDDPEGLKSNYVSGDADWIDFQATVSTDPDQIAIAPGYLQREWFENGRRYFAYKMDVPILNFFAFQSARYAVRKGQWRDVPIEVYYHPGHEYNLDRMIASAQAALEYCSAAFGPYQHKQFRIIEFPRYAMFAQAFPNTIPYSEGLGFIARVRDGDEKDVDYPYYVTAHEAAHQWWAHQVMGGNVQGSTLLSETLAQYSALMVMKKKYGEAGMKKFLAYEMDRYLLGRAFEQKQEVPLSRVENQQYIHYSKGSVVMYALQDYIGEDNVNRALKAFRDEVAYRGPPYPNATLLLKHLRAVTPPKYQYVIDDMFEDIVLFDNRATRAGYRELPDGRFEVTMRVIAKKRRADKLGKEEDAPLHDWIDVGVLDEKGLPILLEKRRFETEESEIVVIVDRPPARAGIDPLNKLIDRRPKDNTVTVEKSQQ